MANRVTGDEVKEIISTSLTAAQIASFITAANRIVTNTLTGSTATAADKKEIERWLTAHLICIRDPRKKSEKIGDAQDTYDTGNKGKRLESTEYGKTVLLIDPTGLMCNVGKRPAKIEAIWDSSSSSA